MEQRTEHSTSTHTIAGPTPSPSAHAAPRFTVLRRTLRLMLRRVLYVLARIAQPLRRNLPSSLLTAALAGVIAWMGFLLWSPAAAAQVDMRAPLVEPSAPVQNYIKGQQNYNAELMWTALSSESQASRLSGGSTKQSLQSQIDQKKDSDVRYNRYDYIGGVQTDGGGDMFFYSVDVQIQNQTYKLPMTFVVNADGKIENIISHSVLSDLATPSQ